MIGLDPEMLVLDPEGYIVPGELFLSTGDKKAPVAYDNAAVELRPPPGSCNAGLHTNLREFMWDAVRQMRLARRQGKIPPGSEYSMVPSAKLRHHMMLLPSVREFGCNPAHRVDIDLSVDEVQPFVQGTDTDIRTAGYHTHVQLANPEPRPVGKTTDRHGYAYNTYHNDFDTVENAFAYLIPRVAFLDATLGLVDVMMNHRAGWTDASYDRRSVVGYGRAGEFRLTQLDTTASGVYRESTWRHFEYRTMSPWPMSSPMWSWWATSVTRQVMTRMLIGDLLGKLPHRSEVVDAINTNDNPLAESLWAAFIKVWDGMSGTFFHGSDDGDGLSRLNLRYVQAALDNGGFKFYMPNGWDYFHAWFNANRAIRQKNSERYKYRVRFISSLGRGGAYGIPGGALKHNRELPKGGSGRHEDVYPTARYFPSGPARIIEQFHPKESLKEWTLLVGEVADFRDDHDGLVEEGEYGGYEYDDFDDEEVA